MDGLDTHERFVLLSLADHADDEARCYPSVPRLARRTSMSDRGVRKVFNRLVERGLLSIIPNAGRAGSNLYVLCLNPEPRSAPEPHSGGTPFSPPLNPVPQTPEPGSAKPSITINEPSLFGGDAPKPKKRQRPFTDIPEGWVPNDANIAHAKSKGFTDQEIEHEADQFRNGHTSKGNQFRDWDAAWRTWIGNAGKFARGGVVGKAAPFGRGQGRSLASIVAERRISGAHD